MASMHIGWLFRSQGPAQPRGFTSGSCCLAPVINKLQIHDDFDRTEGANLWKTSVKFYLNAQGRYRENLTTQRDQTTDTR